MEQDQKLENLICPKGHSVEQITENFGKDDSEGLLDADGVPMYEIGYYCYLCNETYGLSKYKSKP